MAADLLHADFAARLHEVCDRLDIPRARGRQTELAKRYGVTAKAARKWLEGIGFPELSTAMRISADAGVSVVWLLQGKGSKYVDDARNEPPQRLGQIIDALPATDRDDAIEFVRYKLERSRQWFSPETTAAYMRFLDTLTRAAKPR